MRLDQNNQYKLLLSAIVEKYGLNLTSKQCAEALGISTRTLDERRKNLRDVPKFIETNTGSRGILYPVQNVVEYQMEKTLQSIQTT